jgi:hypothetical protein
MRRYIRLALGLLALGIAPAVIRSQLEATGATPEDAQTAVRKARFASERLDEPGQPDIYKHNRVLFCRNTHAAECAAIVAKALCDDLADAGPDQATCEAGEALTFPKGAAVCNSSDVDIGRMTRGVYRDRDRDALNAAELIEQAAGRSFSAMTEAGWETRLSTQTWHLCPEVAP